MVFVTEEEEGTGSVAMLPCGVHVWVGGTERGHLLPYIVIGITMPSVTALPLPVREAGGHVLIEEPGLPIHTE